MALVLNEEQQMLKESAAGFLAEKASTDQLRRLRDGGDERGYNSDVWAEMAAMGWAGIAIPEAFGGLGYGYTGLGLVLEQTGRHLSASPLQSSVLVAATLINELGSPAQREQYLPGIAAGESLWTLALQEGPHFAPEHSAMTATAVDGGWQLSGEKRLVLDAVEADNFIVIARSAGVAGESAGLTAFVMPADSQGLEVQRRQLVDSRSAGALRLNDVTVPAEAVLGETGQAWGGLQRALDIANIGLSAELLGIATQSFEMTVAYLKERKQFGQAIGSFQSLQHRAAELFAELELARSVVLKALQTADSDDPNTRNLSLQASLAKAKLCEVAQRATNEGIQMHGGIGMTDEYDIGFYLKRARVAQHLFGDYYYHLDRFAQLQGF